MSSRAATDQAENVAPLISIVTVCYNMHDTLVDTVQSVLAQKADDVEYIVVDGGSTDGTKEFLEQTGGIDRWVSEPDRGMYDALNKGMSMARGQVIGQINADDLYAPGAFDVVREQWNKQPFDLYYGDSLILDPTGKTIRRVKARRWSNPRFTANSFMHSACFISRSILERIGDYDPTLRIAGDIDLLQRIVYHPGKVRFSNDLISKQRVGGMSHSLRGELKGMREYRVVNRRNGMSALAADGMFLLQLLNRGVHHFRVFGGRLRRRLLGGSPDEDYSGRRSG